MANEQVLRTNRFGDKVITVTANGFSGDEQIERLRLSPEALAHLALKQKTYDRKHRLSAGSQHHVAITPFLVENNARFGYRTIAQTRRLLRDRYGADNGRTTGEIACLLSLTLTPDLMTKHCLQDVAVLHTPIYLGGYPHEFHYLLVPGLYKSLAENDSVGLGICYGLPHYYWPEHFTRPRVTGMFGSVARVVEDPFL